jgi:hypothetical protein
MADQNAVLFDVVRDACLLVNKLEPPEQKKAILMILAAFGVDAPESGGPLQRPGRLPRGPLEGGTELGGETQGEPPLHRKLVHWMKKNNVTDEELARVFEADSSYEFIGHLPDGANSVKSLNCYLLTGMQAFLRTGDPTFRDADAMALCKSEHCYDVSNHSTTRASILRRKYILGSKDETFVLSSAGQEAAAALVKTMAGDE